MKAICSAILIISLFIHANTCLAGDKEKFHYNKDIAIRYTVIALEEYNYNNQQLREDISEYSINNALTFPIVSMDCDKNKRNVVLVMLPKKNKKGHYAYVYLSLSDKSYYDKTGYFLVHRRGYTIQSVERKIMEAKVTDPRKPGYDDFWGCEHP